MRGVYQCKESQKDTGKSAVSVAATYSSRMPAPKVNSGIAQSRNARLSASVRMKRTGESAIRTVWNINISRPTGGTRPILVTAAKEDPETINYQRKTAIKPARGCEKSGQNARLTKAR
ncbi:MAG: hypothetical protein KAI72_04560 [Candidatus Pacebacteria bacterium]|nr:hypothetical protein [Candidatus Paceibacterota bacterium]